MSRRKSQDELETVKDILEYFLRNPHAADTVEGITRLRLLEETINRSLDETNKALSWLVAEGYLRVESILGSAPIFCLNQKKRTDAQHFLAKTGTTQTELGAE